MKHKFLIAAVTTLGLATNTASISNVSLVQASEHPYTSTFWNKPRTVIVTKKRTFKHLNTRTQEFTGTKKVVKPGQKIKVKTAYDFIGWSLANKRSGHYEWVTEQYGGKWMKEYHKKSKTMHKNKSSQLNKKSAISSKDKKPYFSSNPFNGTYVNIPNEGKMHFEGLDITQSQLVFYGKFDNPYNKQIDLNNYLNNYIRFWDIRINHAVQFTTSTIVSPYQTVRFKATCPIPACDQKAVHDGLDIDIRIDAFKNHTDISAMGFKIFTAEFHY